MLAANTGASTSQPSPSGIDATIANDQPEQAVDQHRQHVAKARVETRLRGGNGLVVAQRDQRRSEPEGHHQRDPEQQPEQHREERADAQCGQRGHSRLQRVARQERSDAGHAHRGEQEGADDDHDRERADEIEQADDHQRPQPVGKSAEEMFDPQLAAAILRAAARQHATGEHGRQQGGRQRAQHRDEGEHHHDDHVQNGDGDPYAGRRREEAPALAPPGGAVAGGYGRGAPGAGRQATRESKPVALPESRRGGVGSSMGQGRRARRCGRA